MDQDVVACRQPGARGREAPAGHEGRPVRRVASSAGPRLEHPDPPDAAADAPWLPRPCLEGRGGARHAAGVEGRLVAADQRAECSRTRPGHPDVRDRPPQPCVVVEPGLGGVLRARGPGPVRTGVGAVRGRAAGLTVRELAAEPRGAAPLAVLPGPSLTAKPPVATGRARRGAVEAAKGSALPQHHARRRRGIAAAPRGSALAVRWVETRGVGGAWCPSDAGLRRRWTPASSPGGAQACRRGGPDACGRRPRSVRAARHAPGTRLLGLGAVAVDRAIPPRPGAGTLKPGSTRRDPRRAKPFPRPVGPEDRPICPALPAPDVEPHARALEGAPVELGAFLQAQAPGGERGEAHAVARPSHAAEPPADRCAAEEHRQRGLAWRAPTAPGGPVAVEGLCEAARQAAPRERARPAGVLLDRRAGAAGRSACCRRAHVWCVAIVRRQWAHGPAVPVLRTRRPPPALDTRDHAPAQGCPGSTS